MSKSVTAPSAGSAKKVIFLTVFLDLVGFGIFITLNNFLARHFQASAVEIGWLMAVYSIGQFVFAPFWGRVSDRIGRRPVLLISILGGSLSYLALAFAPSLLWMFVSRTLAGVFAANISTAHAYIADITSEKDRASGMGLIGAAFGIGFIVGPALGSLFFYLGQQLGDQPPFGIFFPAFMAFVITFANLVWAYFALPETVDKKPYSAKRFEWVKVFSEQRLVSHLIIVFFTVNFAMPLMEVMLFTLVDDKFHWTFKEAGLGFALVGVIMAITQGVLVRGLMPRWGERKILVSGMVLLAFAFYLISVAGTIAMLAVAMTALAIGNGFARPALLAMVSLLSDKQQQGLVMGASQSAASLGRILGPIAGGWLYATISMGSPFFAAGCVTLCGLFILLFKYKLLPDQRRSSHG
jgi:DHA1 family tetracycline resistance protein-like MFS transporter